jgi:hypothetical protein
LVLIPKLFLLVIAFLPLGLRRSTNSPAKADRLEFRIFISEALPLSAAKLSCVVLLCLSSLLCVGQQAKPAKAPQSSVRLVQIGMRTYSDGSRTPIWAVMLGDTSDAEKTAYRFRRLGPYALNATLWTHGDAPAAWIRTTYNRPQNADEAAALLHDSESFTQRDEGDASLLPLPLIGLGAHLAKVDYIVRYDDGSAKAYLYAGTSQSDAELITTAIAEY